MYALHRIEPMRVKILDILLLATTFFIGCNTPHEEIIERPDADELTFEIVFDHIGAHEVWFDVIPSCDSVTYGCGVAESSIAALADDYALAHLAQRDSHYHKAKGALSFHGGGYMAESEQTIIIHYDTSTYDAKISENTKAYTVNFKTLAMPKCNNSITSVELFGPYLRDEILRLDPAISGVEAETEGMWYFWRIETENDDIAKIYSYPTYQLGMLEQYERLFALMIEQSWRDTSNYVNHPWPNYIVVYAMVEDSNGGMSDIVESNYLNNTMQSRNAQEFVDFYHEQQNK